MDRPGRRGRQSPDRRTRIGRALKPDLTSARVDAAIRAGWEVTAGPGRRRSITEVVESALVELFDSLGAPPAGVALACVGSLARRELGPRSDIDLVLLHDGADQPKVSLIAEQLWYPLWDSKLQLDHSVRTPTECLEVATRELKAGIGLLDLRLVAGDAALVAQTRSALLTNWRSTARKRLPELLSVLTERVESHGDAAYLLEPDLKESRGGFRDVITMRALSASWLADRPHDSVRSAVQRLLDVRDALQVTAGRSMDRLLAAEVTEVASLLGYRDDDALHHAVSLSAREIGHAVDLTVRSARHILPQRRLFSLSRKERRPSLERAPHGLIVHLGEVGLDRFTPPTDPVIGLRAAALAAQRGLTLAPVTAENLGRQAPMLPAPWPAEARESFLEMLASGTNLLPVWEALELAGCITRWIPRWELIRAKTQHNPIHRHTVDRHSVQTVAEAQPFLTQVARPDLLLLACLLHDLGKGVTGGPEHCAVGAPIGREIACTLGFSNADADLVERLIHHHLTLAELATRRDHDDPATIATLVAAVDGRVETLRLLRSLTEADARAAGPAAWSRWRAQLITSLADQVEEQLNGEHHQRVSATEPDLGLARSVALDDRPRVKVTSHPGGLELLIAANDRVGLFADVAGLLATHGISVQAARVNTVQLSPAQAVAIATWRVDRELAADLPDLAYLIKQLQRLEAGDQQVLAGIRRRESRSHLGSSALPYVRRLPEASSSSVVVEIHVANRGGLLYSLGSALAGEQLSIRSAHISTLAGQAIDTFYLTEADGSMPTTERAEQAANLLRQAAG